MFWPLLLLLPACLALPASHQAHPRDALPTIRELAQFSNPSWPENIAVRSNGKLLVTLFSSPQLYQIDPFATNQPPQMVASFPDVLGLLGITELEEDVFALTKGNFSSATGAVDPKSFSVFKADFRKTPPIFTSIANVPQAIMLNGVTAASKGSRYLLSADSMGGVIWRVDMQTGKSDVALNNSFTQPTAPFPAGFGANGVHTRDGFLYFTNSDRGLFRIRIRDDGTPSGEVETLSSFTSADDFAFSRKGSVYLARGKNDAIEVFTPGGQLTRLRFTNADAAVLLEGGTAVAFGRTERDRNTLYVTTNGGWSGLVPGTEQVGGRVLAIDLGKAC